MVNKNLTTNFDGLVLLFSRRGTGKTAARLHAETCSVVKRASSSDVVITGAEYVADEVRDLRERGWKVSRCPCALSNFTGKIVPKT